MVFSIKSPIIIRIYSLFIRQKSLSKIGKKFVKKLLKTVDIIFPLQYYIKAFTKRERSTLKTERKGLRRKKEVQEEIPS